MTTLRRLIGSMDNGTWGSDPDGQNDVPCVRAADFNFSGLTVDLTNAPLRSVPVSTQLRLQLRPGDLVLEKSGGGEHQPVGRAVLYDSPGRAVCSNFAARIRPARDVQSRYLCYLLAGLYYRGSTQACVLQTTGIQNLDTDAWLQVEVPRHAIAEQNRIVDFIDDQAARIMRLRNARQQQIDCLREEVDAIWSTEAARFETRAPLRRLLSSITDGPFGSALTSAHYADTGTRVVRLGNLGLAHFRDSDKAFVSAEYGERLRQYAVMPGDVLMAGLGDDRWPLGRSSVAPPHLGPALVKADCYRLRFHSDINPDFAAWYLSSPLARSEFMALARGSTRARINTSLAREVLMPAASLSTQIETVERFDQVRDSLNGAISRFERQVQLLEELKESLITTAVTGQFDVSTADGSQVPIA